LEVGLTFWPLVSRLVVLAILALLVLLLLPAFRYRERSAPRVPAYALAAIIFVVLLATLYSAFQPRPLATADGMPSPTPGTAVGTIEGTDWPHYGRTPSGTRFAPLDQITPENVAGLQVAWTYRTGEMASPASQRCRRSASLRSSAAGNSAC
jgi:quinate dehydrogenase (quinone)